VVLPCSSSLEPIASLPGALPVQRRDHWASLSIWKRGMPTDSLRAADPFVIDALGGDAPMNCPE
jgi:hypothetical protein